MHGSLQRRSRIALTSVASLGVLTAAASFLTTPATPALAFDKVAVSPAAAGTEVVYGKVTQPNGRGFFGARVTVSSQSTNSILSTGFTQNEGTYRTTSLATCGKFRVAVSAVVRSHVAHSSEVLRMCPGHDYRISAHLTQRGHFVF